MTYNLYKNTIYLFVIIVSVSFSKNFCSYCQRFCRYLFIFHSICKRCPVMYFSVSFCFFNVLETYILFGCLCQLQGNLSCIVYINSSLLILLYSEKNISFKHCQMYCVPSSCISAISAVIFYFCCLEKM